MKFRICFVTNSSSTSYVSAVTGEIISGWDLSLSDWDWARCVNEHTFEMEYLIANKLSAEGMRDSMARDLRGDLLRLEGYIADRSSDRAIENIPYWEQRHAATTSELAALMDMNDDEYIIELYDEINEDGYPEIQCPACTLASINENNTLAYLLKTKKPERSRSDIHEEIREKFSNLEEFLSWLREKPESESQPES